jgi:hypothetical protein
MSNVRQLTDDQVVAAIGRGARIHHVATRLSLADKARGALQRRLVRLEAAGRVYRPAALQASSGPFWQVTP